MQLPLTEARDHFEAQGARDALVEASGVCRVIAVSLNKIAADIRWMGSGPNAGLAEIHIPDLQPGSSIMPGKVNPVVAEAVQQVVAQVIGNDAAVAWGGAMGNFELNVMLPVIARNLLESIRLLSAVSRVFADKCIHGIEADEERCYRYAASSPAIATGAQPAHRLRSRGARREAGPEGGPYDPRHRRRRGTRQRGRSRQGARRDGDDEGRRREVGAARPGRGRRGRAIGKGNEMVRGALRLQARRRV